MLRESLLIFLGVLGTLKGLYEARSVPFIGSYLSTFVALALVYPPAVHVTLRKIPVTLFEKTGKELVSSLRVGFSSILLIFPPFLLLNHLYQKIVFDRHWALGSADFSLERIVVQLFLIAFPEEFFFRGYLQPILSRSYPRKINFRKLRIPGLRNLSVGIAVPIASFLFAASHSVITLQWWHFSIFFPSLLFGWLREKTGGLVAPIVVHALSNLLVIWIGDSYHPW